jgi:hypothetical protein
LFCDFSPKPDITNPVCNVETHSDPRFHDSPVQIEHNRKSTDWEFRSLIGRSKGRRFSLGRTADGPSESRALGGDTIRGSAVTP